MKVLEIYDKIGLEKINIDGKTVSQIMDDFFMKYPKEFRANYDKNIETLELWKVDSHYDDIDLTTGEFLPDNNIILFTNKNALPHELFHLASFDKANKRQAYVKDYNALLFEVAYCEGMTEYLRMLALNKMNPDSYALSVYAASSVSYIDGLIERYFIPDYDKFIKLFPNKKDIISLMYSLSGFSSLFDDPKNNKVLKDCYRNVIDSIIDIRQSFNYGLKENMEYADYLMSNLEENKLLCDTMKNFYRGYQDYTYGEIKKRILKR